MPTLCVWFGASGGRVCGFAELATSWPCVLRSSQMSPTDPTPAAAQVRVPAFVIGTVTRCSAPVSTAMAVFDTW